MVLTYQNSDDAIQACFTLKESTYEERNLSGNNVVIKLFFLPNTSGRFI